DHLGRILRQVRGQQSGVSVSGENRRRESQPLFQIREPAERQVEAWPGSRPRNCPEIAPRSSMTSGRLATIAQDIQGCRRCPLYRNATQGVAGAGKARAVLMLVGEQPGDREDLAGQPFVGPAGLMLDRALAEAGIARR